jgi:hypothetical protein
MWGNIRCAIDGAQFDTSNQIKIFDQNGNGTYVSTGVTLSAASGWTTAMHDDTGTGFDLNTAFLGKTTDGTESNGSFGDYQNTPSTSDNVCYHGGRWGFGSSAGLFLMHLGLDASYAVLSLGFRLAKV